ncbi:BspA family leucine-rich repeat surface protein [Bifidobacterium sp. ESL0763]|uniref:BspA family leucine-rich repeat surface protein n=1 Tax=Bifidobacterium sp. ESL0763 TaxID=2983227 RepID=UPI0023F7D533|nr:BspA family leucine-rich repeat surface protein [Bifidobacterium sp. ESL0763]MDF7664473.1 BspA family leucine-rich repeat surface protein [Bifidobacterium sp. ESL0763]
MSMNRKLTIAIGTLAAAATLSFPAFSNAAEIQRSHPEITTPTSQTTSEPTQATSSEGQTTDKHADTNKPTASKTDTKSKPATPKAQGDEQDASSYTRANYSTVNTDLSTGILTITAAQGGSSLDTANTSWKDDPSVKKIEFKGGTTTLPANCENLFARVPNLTTITGWDHVDASDVTDMKFMFSSNPKLTSMDLSGMSNTGSVTTMYGMFQSDKELTNIGVGGLVKSSTTDISSMFEDCWKLTGIDASTWDTSGLTRAFQTFADCKSMTSVNISNWKTGMNASLNNMFYDCEKLTTVIDANFDTSKVKNMAGMFYRCLELPGLDVSGWKTGNVDDMSGMFFTCPKLASLDVSGWNTGEVQNMTMMFGNNIELTGLDVSGWQVGNVTNLALAFFNCKKLTALDVSQWDTHSVQSLAGTFTLDKALTNLDVSGWDTSAVTNMSNPSVGLPNGTFEGCTGLTALDVSGWDTHAVTNMNRAFKDCTGLTSLNLTGWNTSAATMTDMLAGCTKLAQISVGPATKLASNANLPAAPTDATHTGSWIQLAIPATPSASVDETATYAAADLLTRTQSTSDTTVPGTYVLQQKHTLTLQANAPTGTRPDTATQDSDILGGIGTNVPAYNAAGTLVTTHPTLGTKTAVPANPFTLSDDGTDASAFHFTKWIDPATHAAHDAGDTMDFPDGDVVLNAQWADRSGNPAPGSDPGSNPGQPSQPGQPGNNNAGKPGVDNPKLVQTGSTVLPAIAMMTVALLAAGTITIRKTRMNK